MYLSVLFSRITNVMDHCGFVCFQRMRQQCHQKKIDPIQKRRLQCVQEKIDPMQNISCHVFRTRSISFVNVVISRFQNLNTHKCYVIFNRFLTRADADSNLRQTLSRLGIAILLLCAGMDLDAPWRCSPNLPVYKKTEARPAERLRNP